ncbi:MAG: 4-hydroxy-tetrahydrodipicolinate reductase [Candidatus Lokiarchaeota archaeon]|nr:4-hydroxy-tetrahydrodipicolinate reductase [Candidatus Lokiarchaeota archaeon]
MIRLLILGPSGSTGRLISSLALTDNEIKVVAACDLAHIGEDLGSLLAILNPDNIKIKDVDQLQEIINETNPDVVVDFTVASATEKNCKICVKNGIRCVIGTTAMSKEFLEDFEELVEKHKAPSVISPNMATGVNVLFKIAGILTNYLNAWDIELIESHHHRKVDSPSGTALTIAKTICDTLGCDLEETLKFGRSRGPNKRKLGAKNEIGIHSIRGGDIVGDHTVLYAGPGERIELKHQAHSRECFANGAIKAIKFIAKQNEIRIFSMKDVLNL